MENVKIRILRYEDLNAIVEIDQKVLGENRRNYWERKLELMKNKSSQISLVAELEGKTGHLHCRHRGQDGARDGTSRLDRSPHAGCWRCDGEGSGHPRRLHRSRKIPCSLNTKRRQNSSDGNDKVYASSLNPPP